VWAVDERQWILDVTSDRAPVTGPAEVGQRTTAGVPNRLFEEIAEAVARDRLVKEETLGQLIQQGV
jgi:hypothetical protein